MKRRILIIASIAMAVSTASLAEPASDTQPGEATVKEGAVVIGTAAAGALLGGPIGYLAGALTGVWLADKIAKADELQASARYLGEAQERIAMLTVELAHADAEAGVLETELLTSRQAMTRYQQLASRYVSFELMFHTGASGLVPESGRRLAQLAQFLAEQPDIDVTLSGHADPRGDDQYNLALTEDRVQTIATVLEEKGVDAARIVRNAFGDQYSLAPDGDLDAYALERRVTIELAVPAPSTELARVGH